MAESEEIKHTAPPPSTATGGAGTTGRAFISYASADAGVAQRVCAELEAAGLSCWIAPRDVVPGEFYADAIVRAIDAASVLVLVLSKNSVESPHVLREVERGSSKRHPLVSFRIDLAPLPSGLEYFLNTSHWLDASATGVD
ncbi:MAG TPA: toll/interleukin-1 receptor domain-containing protein, partial [Steroidobacteraceae bacterium]